MVKDINTLFATIKSLGIFLYAPGFVYIFPDLPQWIGRIFPTYYIIQPVLEVSQNNAGLAEVAPELGILIGLILLSSVLLAALAQRQTEVMAAV
jgi:ABC-2 type transport system permease protein